MELILDFENDMLRTYGALKAGKLADVPAMLSEGRTHYDCDGWTVKIVGHRDGKYIEVYHHTSLNERRTDYHQFKLRDGVLQICYNKFSGEKNTVKFHTGQATSDVLEEILGVTKIVTGSPNFQRPYVWNPRGEATGRIVMTWLVTDGEHIASGYDGCDPETFDILKGACGEITHAVADATWTVVCTYRKDGDETERDVVLYTEETNLFKISLMLNGYLEESDEYARFEDILERFMVE